MSTHCHIMGTLCLTGPATDEEHYHPHCANCGGCLKVFHPSVTFRFCGECHLASNCREVNGPLGSYWRAELKRFQPREGR